MTVLVGNHDFLTGCKLNGDSVLNAEFCLEYVEISTNGVDKKIFEANFPKEAQKNSILNIERASRLKDIFIAIITL